MPPPFLRVALPWLAGLLMLCGVPHFAHGQGTLTGEQRPCAGVTYTYNATPECGSAYGEWKYVWTVRGGQIVGGGKASDPYASVVWSSSGQLTVRISVVTPSGAPATISKTSTKTEPTGKVTYSVPSGQQEQYCGTLSLSTTLGTPVAGQAVGPYAAICPGSSFTLTYAGSSFVTSVAWYQKTPSGQRYLGTATNASTDFAWTNTIGVPCSTQFIAQPTTCSSALVSSAVVVNVQYPTAGQAQAAQVTVCPNTNFTVDYLSAIGISGVSWAQRTIGSTWQPLSTTTDANTNFRLAKSGGITQRTEFSARPSYCGGATLRYEAENGQLTDGAAMVAADVSRGPFSGTGYVENITQVGRAVTFTVNAPVAGYYSLDERYAAAGYGGMSLYVNSNTQRTLRLSYPPTNSWGSWQVHRTRVLLQAGENTLMYRYDDGDNGYINLDYVQVKPATYEGEDPADAKITAGTGTNGCAENLTNPNNSAVEFTVTVPADGAYALDTRYSCAMSSARLMGIYLDGSTQRLLQATFPPTGGWNTWSTQTLVLSLTAGTHRVKYFYDQEPGGWINIDYVQLVPTATTTVDVFQGQVLAGRAFGSRSVPAGTNQGTVQLVDYMGNITDWQFLPAGSSTWQAMGSTGEEITYENVTATTQYRAVVNACSGLQYSLPCTIQVQADALNWTENRAYDDQGTLTGATRAYFDLAGQAVQTQTKNIGRQSVLATQPLFDVYDQTVGSTLAAPTGTNDFSYQPLFVTQAADASQPYDYRQFGTTSTTNTPQAVGNMAINTLGWYYSRNNTLEPSTPATAYPYARTYAAPDGSTGVVRASAPGESLRLGSGHESVSGTFPVRAELDRYLQLRNQYFPAAALGSGPSSLAFAATQQVSVDPNVTDRLVVQGVAVQDKEGHPIMTARPGDWLSVQNTVEIGWPYRLEKPVGSSYDNPVFTASDPIMVHDANGNWLYTGAADQFAWPSTTGGYTFFSTAPFSLVASSSGTSATYTAQAREAVAFYNFYVQAAGSVTLTPLMSTTEYVLVNTVTEADVTATYRSSPAALPAGFYQLRIQKGSLRLNYQNAYQDISYNFYNQKGQLIGSVAPNGLQQLLNSTASPTAGAPSPALRNGLMVWLPFDEQSGSVVNDASGNGRHATLNSSPWKWMPGQGINKGAVEVTGSSYVQVPLAWQPKAFTISWWTKSYQRFNFNQMVASSGGWGGFMFHTTSDGKIYVGTDFDNCIIAGPNSLELNTWQQFTFTYAGGKGRLYKNGELLATKSGMLDPQAWSYFTFGTGPGGQPSEGLLDDCRVYDRALSEAETKELYQSKLPFFTSYEYDQQGLLLALNETDAGRTEYVYRTDGKIRFSQNSKQRESGAFSYSGYDAIGRTVEVGECTPNDKNSFFSTIYTNNASYIDNRIYGGSGLPGYYSRRDIVRTTYDESNPIRVYGEAPNATHNLTGYTPEFTAGRIATVAKYSSGSPYGSYTRVSQSWYSYDEQGRLTWLVQQTESKPARTLDYTYDFQGKVRTVCYQKNVPAERLTHYYSYDADQRLSKVETGLDDPASPALPHTEQARYEYYLHGPLKRVVLGKDLQGVDYTYTAQGWLKAINDGDLHYDPSRDGTANTLLPDLFGATLQYYSGDYAARNGNGMELSFPERFDGLLSGQGWQTPQKAWSGYRYQYDAKGQLLASDYGGFANYTGRKYGFVPDQNNRYGESNLSYDPNGNLNTLRRTDGVGWSTMNIRYDYSGVNANSNRLTAVKDNGSGQNVIAYTYDALGQMTGQQEQDATKSKYLEYDVTGKVTAVFSDAAKSHPLARYTYDEFGRRLIQQVYSNDYSYQTTYYVRDPSGNEVATYYYNAPEERVELYEQPIYGAARLGTYRRARDQQPAQQLYELNDQLGNTRVVFRRPTTTTYLLTMEGNRVQQEKQDFPDPAGVPVYDQTRSTTYARPSPNGPYYSVRLNDTNRTGPGKRLAVDKGDKISLEVWAYYPSSGTGLIAKQPDKLSTAAAALSIGTTTKPVPQPDGRVSAKQTNPVLSRLSLVATIPLLRSMAGPTPQPLGVPNAALQWVFRKPDGTFISNNTQVTSSSNNGWARLQLDVTADQAGTIDVSLLSYDGNEVYFDDLKIDQTIGPVVEENHFYAYGQRNEGLSWTRQYLRSYEHGYQGQYAKFDAETGYNSFELRMYDTRIGRWIMTDPERQYNSPYVSMGNNPISSVDPSGGCDNPADCPDAWKGGMLEEVIIKPSAEALKNAQAFWDSLKFTADFNLSLDAGIRGKINAPFMDILRASFDINVVSANLLKINYSTANKDKWNYDYAGKSGKTTISNSFDVGVYSLYQGKGPAQLGLGVSGYQEQQIDGNLISSNYKPGGITMNVIAKQFHGPAMKNFPGRAPFAGGKIGRDKDFYGINLSGGAQALLGVDVGIKVGFKQK